MSASGSPADHAALTVPEPARVRSVDPVLLEGVVTRLVSPFDYADRETWLVACTDALVRAASGDAGFVYLSGPDVAGVRILSRDLPAWSVNRLVELSQPPAAPAANDSLAEDLARLDWLAKNSGVTVEPFVTGREGSGERSGVVQTCDMVALSGPAVLETPTFAEVAVPLGIPGSSGVFHRWRGHEVWLNAVYRGVAAPFGAETRRVFASLLPALAAGLDAWDRLDAAQHAFGAAFDQLEAGVALYDIWKQRRAAVNRTLVRLLDADSELQLAELDAFARELAASARSRSLRFTMNGNGPRRVIRTTRGAYRVSAVTLPEAMVTRAGAVAVIVSRIVPVVPSSKKLTGVAGLTRREAEVAHEITLGRSNPAIATRLGLSPHTVRHHIEGVFRKLGVSSRREVAERLLSAEWVENHGG